MVKRRPTNVRNHGLYLSTWALSVQNHGYAWWILMKSLIIVRGRDVGFDWVGRLKISEKQLQITSYMMWALLGILLHREIGVKKLKVLLLLGLTSCCFSFLAGRVWWSSGLVSHLAMLNSDHCHVVLSTPTTSLNRKKKKVFKFEAMWTKEDKCNLIGQSWSSVVFDGSLMFQVVEKLKGCQVSLIEWSKIKFGSLASTIREKRVQL